MVVRAVVAKTFGFIAILVIVLSVVFIIVLDVLKYGFGVNAAVVQHAKKVKRARRPPMMIRFIYVNRETVPSSSSTL